MKMSDLARIAGVSKSTVSRALADNELVNQETRDRIKALAKQHGYRKDTRASNFRLKQVLTIGVLLPSNGTDNWLVDNPFILEMLGVLSDQLELKGHELLLAKHSSSDPSWIREFVETRSVDGIIVLGQSIYHEILDEVAQNYTNLVVWGARLPGQHYVSVGSDNYLGGRLVAEHLLSQGKQRFAFMGDIRSPETCLRYEGLQDTLQAAGFEPPALMDCWECQNELIPNAIDEHLKTSKQFDSIFTANDMLAISVIQSLRERGLRVPEDVAVVGYDNISLARYISPTLTSVHQDRQLAGRLLVDKLFALIDGQEVESVIMPTELIVRDSA